MDLLPNKTDGKILPLTTRRIAASEWNQLVASCMEFITQAGLTPDANDPEQLLNAFKILAANIVVIGDNPPGSLCMGPVASMQGYLLCDGRAVSRTDYAALFAAIGTNFGAGDGSTTFNVPDYRGCFLRGLGGDSAADMYTKQPYGAPDISGAFGGQRDVGRTPQGAFYADEWNNGAGDGSGSSSTGFEASRSNAAYGAASEIRPVNYAVNYFIKY